MSRSEKKILLPLDTECLSDDLRQVLEVCSGPARLKFEEKEDLEMLLEFEEKAIQTVTAYLYILSADSYGEPEGVKSSEYRDLYQRISELSGELADNLDWEGKWNRLPDALRIMSTHYAIEAENADPKGKRPRSSDIRFDLARILVELCANNTISLDVRKAPKSDFAKLFRLCCRAIGVDEPKNVSFYLDAVGDPITNGKQTESGLEQKILELLRSEYLIEDAPIQDES